MSESKKARNDFTLPPVIQTDDGNTRGVGFELEYAGVDLSDSVSMLETLLDCKAEKDNAFSYRLPVEGIGDYRVEVDAALLHEGTYKEYLASAGIDTTNLELERRIDDLIESLASVVVPCEIVTPPLAMDDMDIVQDIVTGLRHRNARGTGHSFLYAFGLHINAEVVSLEAGYLLAHMRAFALLYDWICKDSKVDFFRKLSSYIKPWPAAYLKILLDPAYEPDVDTLVGDYLREVGSRNHALDMLPVFAMLDEEGVKAQAKEPDLVKGRPAFHYRLANSRIDQAHWRVADEWRYWVQVESLAHDDKRKQLLALCRDYLESNQTSVFRPGGLWANHVADALALESP